MHDDAAYCNSREVLIMLRVNPVCLTVKCEMRYCLMMMMMMMISGWTLDGFHTGAFHLFQVTVKR